MAGLFRPCPGHVHFLSNHHEAYIPAQRPQACPHPRFPCPHGHQERPCRPCSPSCQGSQEPDSLNLAPFDVTVRYCFPRTHRLLRPAEFQTVFDSAAFKVGEQHFVLLVRPNGLDHPRLGLVIAKKKVRLSVERNRLKRTIRESFRFHQAQLPAVDVIFMARNDLGSVVSAELAAALGKSWKRLERKAGTRPSAGAAEPQA